MMQQMARNMTLADIGFLSGCRYLLHDRDAKFCAAFDGILEAAGIQALTLPPRSPNLNAHPERWNRSVKEECLSKMIFSRLDRRAAHRNQADERRSRHAEQIQTNLLLVLFFSFTPPGLTGVR